MPSVTAGWSAHGHEPHLSHLECCASHLFICGSEDLQRNDFLAEILDAVSAGSDKMLSFELAC